MVLNSNQLTPYSNNCFGIIAIEFLNFFIIVVSESACAPSTIPGTALASIANSYLNMSMLKWSLDIISQINGCPKTLHQFFSYGGTDVSYIL